MVNGFMGWRGGRAGLINGSLLYGSPALLGPGWTNGGITGHNIVGRLALCEGQL